MRPGRSVDAAILRQITIREDVFGNGFRVGVGAAFSVPYSPGIPVALYALGAPISARLHDRLSCDCAIARFRAHAQRTALKARVRSAVASARAKRAAKNYAFGLRKVCEEVRRKKGAATRG